MQTREQLLAFTERIKAAFLAKQIKAPMHLCSETQIDPLLRIFRDVRPGDHVFSTWRSSYHALLKGIPEQWVFDEILAGRSMYLMNREHRFFSSAIVGGALPIAAGVAMGIKRQMNEKIAKMFEREGVVIPHLLPNMASVWVFIGDMAARTGVFHEFIAYCDGHSLPVRVVIEDNSYSTNTRTEEAWGSSMQCVPDNVPVTRYSYERTEPHVGCGVHVQF